MPTSIPLPAKQFEQIPDFTLIAAGSGRELVLNCPPVAMLLLFHDQHSMDAALAINLAVRARVPDPDRLLIASVANMSSVPKFVRPLAQSALDKGYHDAAARLPDGLNPEDYVLILPDWTGKVTDYTGFTRLDELPGVLLVNTAGQVLGRYQGTEPSGPILVWLEEEGLAGTTDAPG